MISLVALGLRKVSAVQLNVAMDTVLVDIYGAYIYGGSCCEPLTCVGQGGEAEAHRGSRAGHVVAAEDASLYRRLDGSMDGRAEAAGDASVYSG
jgi:hypothetical protein